MLASPAHIYIEPSYDQFLRNGLFNLTDPRLNRDDQLLPFARMKNGIELEGGTVNTADYIEGAGSSGEAGYYSLGLMDRLESVRAAGHASLEAFVIMEPPIVAPHLYRALPRLTQIFRAVYVHNVEGDGYSLEGVDTSRLRRFFWPLPYSGVLTHWGVTDRLERAVVINGNHKAWGKEGELYSERIHAMVELEESDCVDLYGIGWDKWWDRRSWWPAYFRNRKILLGIYKGPCQSKYSIMSRYAFCLCIENMGMKGYITEKIFDCLYSGTIPLYLGAPDVQKYIPNNCYLDRRHYPSWTQMWRHASSLGHSARAALRENARDFLASKQALNFYNSLDRIVRPQATPTAG